MSAGNGHPKPGLAMFPQIRAVTFDIGGTLIECWPSVGHIYAEVAARHGHGGLSAHVLNQQFKQAWRELKDFHHTREQWAVLVDATFGQLVNPSPSKTFFPEVYARFSEPDAWRVFDDVFPALERFRRRGLKLGALSNWDERLRPLLRELKLDPHFDAIVVSCEVASPKPASVMFQAAANALGFPPDQILHIGDSQEADAQGARLAGFQALLLDRQNATNGPGVARSLSEVR